MGWRERFFGQDKAQDDEKLEADNIEPNLFEDDILWHQGETVIDVLNHISSIKGVAIEKSTKSLNRAIEEGKIRVVDPSPPQSFPSYFVSLYNIWFWTIVGFVGLTIASIYILPQIYPFIALRYITGALFVLFVPGYVLIEALYPKSGELEKLERFALDVGLSLAIVPIIGLVLNYTPWGIRLDPIFTSVSVLILVLGLIAVWRKYSYLKLSI